MTAYNPNSPDTDFFGRRDLIRQIERRFSGRKKIHVEEVLHFLRVPAAPGMVLPPKPAVDDRYVTPDKFVLHGPFTTVTVPSGTPIQTSTDREAHETHLKIEEPELPAPPLRIPGKVTMSFSVQDVNADALRLFYGDPTPVSSPQVKRVFYWRNDRLWVLNVDQIIHQDRGSEIKFSGRPATCHQRHHFAGGKLMGGVTKTDGIWESCGRGWWRQLVADPCPKHKQHRMEDGDREGLVRTGTHETHEECPNYPANMERQ